MATGSRNDKLIEFYAACQSNGYTDMKDKTQSLKAKVIASDLGLNYSRIVALYDEAHKATEEKERLDNISGVLIFTCYSSSVGYEKEKPTLELYRCEDNTYYCVVEGKRVYGEPVVGTQEAILPETTIREPSTTFYGMSYNGMASGTVSYDPGGETTSMKKTGRGSVYIKVGGKKYIIKTVVPAPDMVDAFKRDEEFRQFYNGEALILDSIRQASYSGDIYSMLKQSYLSIPECGRAAELLRRMIQGRLPSSDQALYDKAMKLLSYGSSAEVKEAISIFELISDYEDAFQQKEKAKTRLAEVIQAEKEATIIKKEKGKKTLIIGAIIVLIVALFMYFVGIPNLKLNKAMRLIETGNYDAAYPLLKELGRDDIIKEEENAKAYPIAERLLEEKKYDEAIKAFKALGDYRDSAAKLEEAVEARNAEAYACAEELLLAGNYSEAAEAFQNLGNYRDSKDKIEEVWLAKKEDIYRSARALYSNGDYFASYRKYCSIKGYKDVEKILETDEKLVEAKSSFLVSCKTIGGVVSFGAYEQDSNTKNGKEEIEWIVLDTQDNRSLLLSRFALDGGCYDERYKTSVTWEKCSLRKWLNTTFLDEAFSTDEQEAVLLTNIDNSKVQGNSAWSTTGGNNTQDRLFLLSCNEMAHYFPDYHDGGCEPTKYAIEQGANVPTYIHPPTTNCDPVWLRSPGERQECAAFVGYSGYINSSVASNHSGAIRPAFWLDLESNIF